MRNSTDSLSARKLPDEYGHFGVFGGRYVAETLMPALLELDGARSFLYAEQDRRDGNKPIYRAIAAAFAPGNVKLPPAGDFPDTP